MENKSWGKSEWRHLYAAIISIFILWGLGVTVSEGFSDPLGFFIFGSIIWAIVRYIWSMFADCFSE